MNNIELITKFSPKAWDTVYRQESVISLLDTNKELVKFTGAKTVKIAKWQNGGLQDYYRNNIGDDRVLAPSASGDYNFVGASGFGYQRSATRLVWEEFTMKCDRAAAFQIEKFDNEESGEELVGLGVSEISRTTIVPEVDAYALSTIASFTSESLGNRVVEDITDKPLSKLNAAFTWMAEHEVPIQDQLAYVSPAYMNLLRSTDEVTRFMGQTDFDNKDVKFLITKYEGRTLVEVSPERLRTNIEIFGREGYGWKATSKPINFLLVAKSAVTHVVKYEKVKVIGDDLNLAGNGFDGYTIYARVYHDVFVPDNKRIALYASIASTDKKAPEAIDVRLDGGRVEGITYHPGSKLVSYGYSTTEVTVGAEVPEDTKVLRVGTVLEGTAYVFGYVGNKVTAVQKVTIA